MLATITETSYPYQALLGQAWVNLPPGVRRSYSTPLSATGTLRISGPESIVGRLVARLMKLPPSGECVATRLHVSRNGAVVRWNRLFGTFPVVSTHRVRRHYFVERAGPFGLLIRPEVADGALVHRQVGLRLFGLPIP